jgi:hypothetical protein
VAHTAPKSPEVLLAMVKAHAAKNYERDGWDYLIECHDDEEVLEAIGKATTFRGAIANVRAKFALGLHDEMRRSVRNEIF